MRLYKSKVNCCWGLCLFIIIVWNTVGSLLYFVKVLYTVFINNKDTNIYLIRLYFKYPSVLYIIIK